MLGRRKSIAAIAVLCVSLPASLVRANADEGVLTGPSVVTYQAPGALADATRMTIHGYRTPDGSCAFPVDESIPVGVARIAQYELARDPSTCTSLVERGIPVTPSPSQSAAPATSTTTCPPGEFDNGWSPNPPPQSCLYTCQGSTGANGVHCTTLTLHAFFQDPFGIQVVQGFDTIAWWWPPTSGCVLIPGRPNSGWDSDQEFPDGWSLNSHSFSTTAFPDTNGASGGCSAESTSSVFTWDNSGFCNALNPLGALLGGNTPVFADLNPTTVTGNTDGTGSIQTTWSLSGSCSNLLSFNYDIQQLVDATDIPDYGLPGYPLKTTPV